MISVGEKILGKSRILARFSAHIKGPKSRENTPPVRFFFIFLNRFFLTFYCDDATVSSPTDRAPVFVQPDFLKVVSFRFVNHKGSAGFTCAMRIYVLNASSSVTGAFRYKAEPDLIRYPIPLYSKLK
jgi:hypothetical protein